MKLLSMRGWRIWNWIPAPRILLTSFTFSALSYHLPAKRTVSSSNWFKILHCRAGESSLGNSIASSNKRFFKGSLPSQQQQALVQSSSASRSSRQLRRSREDEYAIYNIDNVDAENVPKLSCCQRTQSFFKNYAFVFQMIVILTFLCLPGNIVTVVLQLQSPTVPSRYTARIPKELEASDATMLYVPTTAMGYMVGKSAATMAHTDGYVLPTLPTQSQNPRDLAKTLIGMKDCSNDIF